MKKCLLYLKKKSFFNIEDIYNIKEILQCRFCSSPSITRHMSRSREAFYIWLYAGLQDTMLAVLSRVLSWYVSQSYLLLDVFFFLSLKKKSLLLFAINCCDMSVEFQCFNGSHFQAQCALFSAVTIFHNFIFYVRVVKFTQFRFFSRWALLYLPSQLRHCILYLKTCTF